MIMCEQENDMGKAMIKRLIKKIDFTGMCKQIKK